MIQNIDPGHTYELLVLDSEKYLDSHLGMYLQFVKRMDPPERFPGNTTEHKGTTLQSVLRCLRDRMKYLQEQEPCDENVVIIEHLEMCNWLLESRAARRHGLSLNLNKVEAIEAPMCRICGHIACKCLG